MRKTRYWLLSEKKPQAGSARERLAQISHHFLSEDAGLPEQQGALFVDLVVLRQPAPAVDFPLTLLASALCQQGAPGVAVMPQTTAAQLLTYYTSLDRQADTPENTEHKQVFRRLQSGLNTPSHPLCYLLQASSEATPDLAGKQCLLLANASHSGLQEAYAHLKKIAAENRPAVIGITISQARNPQVARYHYSKLAAAAQRFLGLAVHSYGALPAAPAPWSDAARHATAWQDTINHIALMIIRDWHEHQQSKTPHKERNIP